MKKLIFKISVLIIIFSLPKQGVSMSYFNDTATISGNTFTAGFWEEEQGDSASVVINEVYYNVAPDKGDEGNSANPDEWVELYNNSDSPVNLKNWRIDDNSGSNTIIHANVYIPAKGFAVLAKNASTWTYWSIPTEAKKISLGQKIGNGLDNDGDRVILRDNNGVEVDAVNWGTDTYAFAPSISDVPEGHSISRIVKGVDDANTAADWMDTHPGSSPPGPNPGTNPHPPEWKEPGEDEDEIVNEPEEPAGEEMSTSEVEENEDEIETPEEEVSEEDEVEDQIQETEPESGVEEEPEEEAGEEQEKELPPVDQPPATETEEEKPVIDGESQEEISAETPVAEPPEEPEVEELKIYD